MSSLSSALSTILFVCRAPATTRVRSGGFLEQRLAHRVTVVAATAIAVMTVAISGPLAMSARADGCPNAELRAQNGSTELPDCRAYELVTSPYKEGFELLVQTFTDDGAFAYSSTGSFAGNGYGDAENQYVARRGASGWTTTAMTAPATLYTNPQSSAEFLSADLGSLANVLTSVDDPAAATDWYLRGTDGAFTRIGEGAIPGVVTALARGFLASADLSHVVFGHEPGSGNPVIAAMYEFVGTGNEGPGRPVSVDNTGQQVPPEACPKAISTDGRVIVFSSGCNGQGVGQVWARVAGTATVAVSGSQCTRTAGDPGGACNGFAQADYAGASVDGSRVLFTTTEQLVNGDTDQTSDLYACQIPSGTPSPIGAANPCASLTELSGTATGAQVESVVAVSDDASRVYFMAQGVLASNLGVNDVAAVGGRDNLYVSQIDAAHPGGTTRFVAQLDSNDLQRAQATADGRFLVFGTATPLVQSGPAADTDAAFDVYRYDLDNGTMVRVSTSTAGGGGNDLGFDAVAGRPNARLGAYMPSRQVAMTSDGVTVVFQSDEPLSPRDIDGGADVYAWHDGHVSLISDGVVGGTEPWITGTGQDIFFVTTGHLTTADGDANADVYDARVDGGFDFRQAAPCSGDACQGAPSGAPDLFRPVPRPLPLPSEVAANPTLTLRAVSAAERRHLAKTGRVTLKVSSNRAGIVSATGMASIQERPTTVASARRAMISPGAVTLTLTLSRTAREELAAQGKLRISVLVRHSKVAVDRYAALKLIRSGSTKTVKRTAAGDKGGRS